MGAVIREVFFSLALHAVHSSRRLPGSTAAVAGSDLAITAMNDRPLETAFSNPSAARSVNRDHKVNAATEEPGIN